MLEAFAAQAAVALRQERLPSRRPTGRAAGRGRPDAHRAARRRQPRPAHPARVGQGRRGEPAQHRRRLVDAEDREELLATADESLDRLDRLVDNLLDMSRLQAGVLGLTLAADRRGGGRARAPSTTSATAGREVEGDVPDDLPEVIADPALLERILVNLMSNAVRYSPADGKRRWSPRSEHGGRVEIRVIDRGRASRAEAHDRVFLPFQRLGDRDNDTGVGLGLALSRGLAEAMGGTLAPEETPGGGLTMTLTLPRRRVATSIGAARDAATAGAARRPASRHGRDRMTRVLVVDDEPQILRALRINLAARQYEVAVAAGRRTALRAGRRLASRPGRPRPRPAGHATGVDVIHGLRGWTADADHRAVRPGAAARTRSTRWTPAPTTT